MVGFAGSLGRGSGLGGGWIRKTRSRPHRIYRVQEAAEIEAAEICHVHDRRGLFIAAISFDDFLSPHLQKTLLPLQIRMCPPPASPPPHFAKVHTASRISITFRVLYR